MRVSYLVVELTVCTPKEETIKIKQKEQNKLYMNAIKNMERCLKGSTIGRLSASKDQPPSLGQPAVSWPGLCDLFYKKKLANGRQKVARLQPG